MKVTVEGHEGEPAELVGDLIQALLSRDYPGRVDTVSEPRDGSAVKVEIIVRGEA